MSESSQRRGGRALAGRLGLERELLPVWLYVALIAAAAAVLLRGPAAALAPIDTGLDVPWWTLVPAFALAELLSVHLPFRREAHTISFGDVPLVAGLLLVSPAGLVGAQLLGAGVVLLGQQRQAPVKAAFNLAQKSLAAVVAVLVFHAAVGSSDPLALAGLLGALAAALVADVVALTLVVGAMSLVRRAAAVEGLGSIFLLGQATTVTNAALGLFGVVILVERPEAAWLVLFPAATVVVAYRSLAHGRNRRSRMQALHAAQRGIVRSPEEAEGMLELLHAARDVFNADVAELTLLRPVGGGEPQRARVGPGDEVRVLDDVTLVPAERELVEALAADGTVLLPRGRRHPYLADRNRRDALATPLAGPSGPLGYIVVADRVTEAESFTGDDVVAIEILAAHAHALIHKRRVERALSRQHELQERLDHETLHDALTGLPNRVLFADRVHQAADRRGACTAVLMFDIDGLARVNETSGHAAGDAVLRSLARRLEAAVPPGATAARVGADEFAVLLDADDDDAALHEASRLREALAGSYETLDGHVHLTLSAGAATSEGDVDGTDLLVRAGLALEAARSAGGARSHGFEPALLEAAVERGRLADELVAALSRGQLVPHYQPIVDLDGGRMVAVEALVRWQHPEHGLLPPARFLPYIEDTPLVLEMGRQVLRQACRDAAGWRARHADLGVTVNVAARQLAEDSLVDEVRDALAAAGLPPQALTIEVTETAAMRDALATRDRLQALRALGVRIAIDDFGTGHSSLSYLQRFDVDVLKIAKEFINVLGRDEQQDAFAATLVRLGELLGLVVVAEGIEEPVQAARLRAVGCPLGQGYLFSRPVDAAGVERLLYGRLAA